MITELITNELVKLKRSIRKQNNLRIVGSNKSRELVQKTKKNLVKKFNIKIDYIECRNIISLTTNLKNKPFKLFVAYYLNNVRLIDNF